MHRSRGFCYNPWKGASISTRQDTSPVLDTCSCSSQMVQKTQLDLQIWTTASTAIPWSLLTLARQYKYYRNPPCVSMASTSDLPQRERSPSPQCKLHSTGAMERESSFAVENLTCSGRLSTKCHLPLSVCCQVG